MKKLFLALILIVTTSIAGFSQISNPVSWEKAITDLGNGEYKLAFTATIEEGWYIYDIKPNEMVLPTVFAYEYEGGEGELVGEMSANAELVKSETYSYWKNSVTLTQNVKVSKDISAINVTIEWMSCNESTCTPPQDEVFTFQIGEKVAATKVVAVKEETKNVIHEDSKKDSKKESSGSLWLILLTAFGAGLASIITPCVFPMIPMTVSFFLKGSGSKAKGRLSAITFGLSIIALYTLPIALMIGATYILGGDSVTADIFNWLATHWLPNTLFGIIFMVFAASFFGAFEIVLPSWMVNKADAQSDKGGLLGIFFMALTLVLVSFSCTGPIVGGIIVKSAQGDDIWEPIITMLAFSTAFAIPFTLFAFFPTLLKNLPKSGGWLNTVKVVIGFVEVAFALKFFSMVDQGYDLGLLDREVYIAMWIVIFTLLGFYLLGKIKFAHDSDEPYLKVKKLFMAIIVFSFVVYMIPGMWGAPLKSLAGYLPPIQTIDFNLPRMISDVEGSGGGQSTAKSDFPSKVLFDDMGFFVHPEGLHGFYDYEEGVAYAKKVGKPVFLDFTGKQCVNCREMEQLVLSDSRVKDLINNNFVLITLYVDSKHELPEAQWVTNENNGRVLKTVGRINSAYQAKKFNSNAQPYYVAIDAEDGEQVGGHIAYDKDVDKYIKFLNNSLEAYKNKQKK